MSHRHRAIRSSVAPARSQSQALNLDELPPYEAPTNPLSARAQEALNRLHTTNSLLKVTKHYDDVRQKIYTQTGYVNDLLVKREEMVQRRKARVQKHEGREIENDDEEVVKYEELKTKVDEVTKRLEKSIREVVDGKTSIQQAEESLAWLRTNGVQATQREYESQRSQRSQSQRRRGRREGDYDPDDPEQDEDMEDADDDGRESPGPTPYNTQGRPLTGPTEQFKHRLQTEKDKYSALSHSIRYGTNNDYVHFKRVVHDALVGEDGPPLPHHSTWFTESGAPALGVTATSRDADESDDDIAIAREKVSTRCPITFQEFEDPVTSSKCPHSFERSAIMDMIRGSVNIIGVGGRRGERAVKCPVTGCDQMLSAPDLAVDPLLVRKIKRIQEANRRGSDDEEDEEEEEESTLAVQTGGAGVGRDEAQWGFDGASEQKPPQSSVVVDLGASDDESDE